MRSEKVGAHEPERADPIPEVLHALCQPLTSLRCALETTLLQPRDSEQYRISLRESLGLAEEISELTAGLRELLDVEKHKPPLTSVGLRDLLRDLIADLLPLASSRNSRIVLQCESPLLVKAGRQELMRALLYVLSFALESGRDATVRIRAWKANQQAEIEILNSRAEAPNLFWPDQATRSRQAARNYLQFLIARSIFERTGGSLWISRETRPATIRGQLAGLVRTRKTRKQGHVQG